MAARVQEACRVLIERYDGDPAVLWGEAQTGAELLKRFSELPEFGKQKAQIMVALLGKQYGVQPTGWREAAGRFGEANSCRSVADIVDDAALAKVREHKQQLKAAAKGWLCSHGLYSEVAEEGVHLDPEGLVVSVDRSPGGGDAIAAPYCYEPGSSRLRRANSSSTSKPGEVAAGGSPVGCCRDASMEGRARRSSRCRRRC